MYVNQKHDYQFKAPCYKRGGDLCYPFPNNPHGTCWSVHMSDTASPLIALGARLEVLGGSGTRQIGIEELYTGSGITPIGLAHGDLLTAILIPKAPARFGWGYCKSTRRGGMEFGIAVIAVTILLDDGLETCRSARIVVGAVRERPVRLAKTEAAMVGSVIDKNAIAEIAAAATKELNPIPHHGFTKSYIRDDFTVKLRRTLDSAVQVAQQPRS